MSAAVVLGLVCAFVLGVAIQRGNTCTVAAVHDALVRKDRSTVVGLVEAMIGVAGILFLLHLTGHLGVDVPRAGITWATLVGGVALGVGAVCNGACATGTVARIGSGNLVFLLTPVGILAGAMVARRLAGVGLPDAHPRPVAAGMVAVVVVVVAAAFAVVRIAGALRRRSGARIERRWWHPRTATAVIALAFVILTLAVGPWAYTDGIAQVAAGTVARPAQLALLVAALFGGALAAGLRRPDFMVTRPTPAAAVRCLIGGALIGVGLELVPGAHDSLTLLGVPTGSPSAVVGLGVTVVVVVGLVLVLERRGVRACACATERLPGRSVVRSGSALPV